MTAYEPMPPIHERVTVVGIDPSLRATGVAGVGGMRTIRTDGSDKDSLRTRAVRLHNACADILTAIYDVSRDARKGADLLVVIEAPYAIGQGKGLDRAGLWWLVVDALDGEEGTDVVQVSTNQRMQYATGKGSADKDVVMLDAARRYPDAGFTNNNEADAFILRAMGCDALGAPLAPVPARHREVLKRITWPDYIDLEQP